MSCPPRPMMSWSLGLLQATAETLKAAALQLTAICEALIAGGNTMRKQEACAALLASASTGAATKDELADLSSMVNGLQECMREVQEQQAQAVPAGDAAAQALEQLRGIDLAKLAVSTLVAVNRMHNATRSSLLSLPGNALSSIARLAGRDARLVCSQLQHAYGCPAKGLFWPRKVLLSPCHYEDGTMQPAFLDIITTWAWPDQLTQLTFSAHAVLQPDILTTIAARFPNLASLTIPWLEKPYPAGQLPPALTALTSLTLEKLEIPGRIYHSGPVMAAFAQWIQLAPQLDTLHLNLGELNCLDTSFAATMKQLQGQLTHLSVVRYSWRNALQPAEDKANLLAGPAAVSGSLQHFEEVYDPHEFGHRTRGTLAKLTQLTCLTVRGHLQSGALTCLPLCSQLPHLQRLECSWLSAWYNQDEAGFNAWLLAGGKGSGVTDLLLPTLSSKRGTLTAAEQMLAACSAYTALTSLQISATTSCTDAPKPCSWPARTAALTGLRQLTVTMDRDEVNSSRGWSALTALTNLHLKLEQPYAQDCPKLVYMVSETVLMAGLGRLTALQHAKLEIRGPARASSEQLLLRSWLLKAFAGLPQLEELDLLRAVQTQELALEADELAALAAGPAGKSLKRVVLDVAHAEEQLRAVRRALPGMWLELERGPISRGIELEREAEEKRRQELANPKVWQYDSSEDDWY